MTDGGSKRWSEDVTRLVLWLDGAAASPGSSGRLTNLLLESGVVPWAKLAAISREISALVSDGSLVVVHEAAADRHVSQIRVTQRGRWAALHRAQAHGLDRSDLPAVRGLLTDHGSEAELRRLIDRVTVALAGSVVECTDLLTTVYEREERIETDPLGVATFFTEVIERLAG